MTRNEYMVARSPWSLERLDITMGINPLTRQVRPRCHTTRADEVRLDYPPSPRAPSLVVASAAAGSAAFCAGRA
eukprot:CAMPEP_0118936822 /NCGR_PEP_ID=MMETSP1169-20130426/20544_1 /TAXON_ID=36882 /ORGANISM="Pyramimonas obovata, Strain CCMP722" /LENGTH=73 /DNA_ID=CAMNT_0006880221 /DNA_START=19 /DNA_END=240 /DNA_ORIENTATION=-